MYPIHSPVISTEWTLINLGILEGPLSNALQGFSNVGGTLTGPFIGAGWGPVATQSSSIDPRSFVASMRRLDDEAEALAARFREIEERMFRNEQRELQLQKEPLKTRSTSTLAIMGTAFDQERVLEMKVRQSSRPSSSPGMSSFRSRWQLAVTPKGRGSVFLCEDGRAIHLHYITITNVVLGYGWHSSAMHYLDIGSIHPSGRSVALFTSEEIPRRDFSHRALLDLFASLWEFYEDSHDPWDPNDRNFLLTRTDIKRAPVQQIMPGGDQEALSRLLRTLSLNDPFTLISERPVAGSRDPKFAAANRPTPQAQVDYAVQNGSAILRKTFYRSQNSKLVGEGGLSEGVKRQLRLLPNAPIRR